MLKLYLLRGLRLNRQLLRCFKPEFSTSQMQKNKQEPPQQQIAPLQQKYQEFRDEDATEIFDVTEERQRKQQTQAEQRREDWDEYKGLNLKRGIRGVFDIEDLVDVLRKASAEDIFVCLVPKELKYVDYMVVCSGRSYRHMLALAEFVRHIYKVKREESDKLPKIEGEKSHDWMAMDLGNIAVHIFSPKSREEYDLESLWAIGSQYDRESNKPENRYEDIIIQSDDPLLEQKNSNIKNNEANKIT